MDIKQLDGLLFEKLIFNGLKNLKQNVKLLNSLNVFPVPDGDTGINMFLTLENGYKKSKSKRNLGEYFAELSRGMLLGARGNSGVILSQLFRGFSQSLKGKSEATTMDLVDALIMGYRMAYQAVVNPQEGTILTVSREGIELIKDKINENTTIDQLIGMYHNQLRLSLAETPKHLSMLREAGVVDSGAYGLATIFEGIVMYLEGIIIEDTELDNSIEEVDTTISTDLSYKYYANFLLQLDYVKIDFIDQNIILIKDELSYISDIMEFNVNENMVKASIATDKPGDIMNICQKYGEFLDIKIGTIEKKEEIDKLTFLGITQGEGLINLLKDFGCKHVIERGSNTTISTDEFLEIFKEIRAENIIVLPNNVSSGIICKYASERISDKRIYVLDTKSPIDSYLAMSMVVGNNLDPEYQVNQMINGFKDSKTIYIKNDGNFFSTIDAKKYEKETLEDIVKFSLSKISNIENKEILVVLKGVNATDEEIDSICELVSELYPNLELGVIDAMQDDYELILGVN